ncbi:MAG: cobaltochelatase subunit CobN [Thiomicrospira sp.]
MMKPLQPIILLLLLLWGAQLHAQPSVKVTLLTTEFVMTHKLKLMQVSAEKQGVKLAWTQVDTDGEAGVQRALNNTDFVIIDTPRGDDQNRVKALAEAHLSKLDVPIIHINRMTRELPLVIVNTSNETGQRIRDYYLGGMAQNREHLFHYIRAYVRQDNLTQVPPPIELPDGALYHPDFSENLFETLEAYLNWWQTHHNQAWSNRPVIAVETTSSYISDGQTSHLDTLIHAIESQGGLPLVHYRSSRLGNARAAAQRPSTNNQRGRPQATDETQSPFPNPQTPHRPFTLDEPLITHQGQILPNVLMVNTFLGGDVEGRKLRYQALNIPVMNIIHYRSDNREVYLQDLAGVSSFHLPTTLMNAEYIGIQDPVVLTSNEDGEMRVMPEQLEMLIGKAFNLAKLQTLPNPDKKLALMFWNHPPGEKNQGASNMNVPRSLEKLSQRLADEGYQVQPVLEQQMIDAVAEMLKPTYRPGALPELMQTDLWDFMPLEAYQVWFKTLPATIQQEMNQHWGLPQTYGALVEHQGELGFVIPRLKLGNLIIMPQPSRSGNDPQADKDAFHDTKMPMNHYYAATYLWVRQHYQTDAIIHFGTHGTQEWHPGKERGLWAYDYPNLAVGNTPILYPYIVDNIGEAIHVKRRGRGVIISHQTPPFSPAGLSDDFVTINDLIREYQMLDDGLVKANNRALIIEQAVKMNIHQDLDWSVAQLEREFEDFLRDIEDYLEDLGSAMQPLGLHTFGNTAEDDHLALNVMLMLGEPLMQKLGIENPRALFRADYREIKNTEPYLFVLNHIVQQQPIKDADTELSAILEQGRVFYHNLKAEHELHALVQGLNARWIDPSYGGDPIRNPDAVPTGRNMYGFDPARVPTRAAYEAGVQAMQELIISHQATHNEFPEKLAFTLWSTETMRHLGMLEAQIFYAMGIKPVWDRGGRVVDLEVIPLTELNRPRIDTIISLTGLYRDQFPNVMERFNQAIVMLAELDEPLEQNLIRANTLRIEQALLDEGIASELARNFALTRVFGNESGDYGTGLPDATLASDQWDETDGKLAELYLSRMSWSYGPDTSQWSQKLTREDGSAINVYAEQLKGTSAAVFSRSSNLRGLLDTDHPFEYLGGISLALQHLDGRAPQLYISNMRDPNRAKLQTAERFLATELRAVYQHPNWMQEMQKEGYSGTLQMLNTINNFWGWQVMDRNVVRDDQWEEFHQTYVMDKYNLDMREWFEQSNPTALAQIAERMLEAIRKDYWQASEQTKRELVEVYQEIAEKHDVFTSNATFKAYVEELARGYGLSPEPALEVEASPAEAVADAGESLETVSGQVMTEREAEPQPTPLKLWIGLLLAIFLLGMAYQAWLNRRPVNQHSQTQGN